MLQPCSAHPSANSFQDIDPMPSDGTNVSGRELANAPNLALRVRRRGGLPIVVAKSRGRRRGGRGARARRKEAHVAKIDRGELSPRGGRVRDPRVASESFPAAELSPSGEGDTCEYL